MMYKPPGVAFQQANGFCQINFPPHVHCNLAIAQPAHRTSCYFPPCDGGLGGSYQPPHFLHQPLRDHVLYSRIDPFVQLLARHGETETQDGIVRCTGFLEQADRVAGCLDHFERTYDAARVPRADPARGGGIECLQSGVEV